MKILIIDDIESSVKGIIDYCKEKNWDVRLSDFNDSYEQIIVFDPDVIVLDWKDDAVKIDTGENILDNIWSACFRPIVVFSANAPVIVIDDKLKESSMLKIFPKGDEQPVIDFLDETERFVFSLATYRKDLGKAIISSLNSIELLKNEDEIEDNAVGYVLSKRTSAFFDKEFIGNLSPSWVQYLCPPVNESLCVCDIIRINSEETDFNVIGNPEEYCIVLTPSCDMCTENGRNPKVSHVLCAHCYPKEEFHGISLSQTPSKTSVKSVVSKLNFGYNEEKVAIPGFANVLPYMTVNFKKLELISLPSIALTVSQTGPDIKYTRIASICSPFREQIVWAYLQTSCRPGVPDRNTNLWAKEILTS